MCVDKSAYSDCPSAAQDGECSLRIKGYRRRETGPGHALAVFKCIVHALCFTVYPPGWIPYARKQLSREGFLRAAFDAANGCLWKDQDEDLENETRTTQVRRIKVCAKLLGYDRDESGQAEIAYKLGIETADLIAVNRKIRDGPMRRKAWGTWIASVFKDQSKPNVKKLLWCGKSAGLWKNHLTWNSSAFV